MTAGDEAPRTFGDRYVLGDRITANDSREVWRAHDDIVSRSVALKIFFGPSAADPTWRRRFRHDAQRLVALSHPGIAKVYEHGEAKDETWLAMAYVDGRPLSERLGAEQRLDDADALDIIGQAALAVKAAHDAGIAHGALRAANLLVRPGGVVAVVGFAVGTQPSQAEDLHALGDIATACLGGAAPGSPEVADFLDWLTNPDRHKPPTDAAEIGRTALALAASLGGHHATAVVPRATAPSAMDDSPGDEPRYDEAERKRVRNRLIILGAIVVIGGGVLLRFVGEGGGDVTVPNVVGLPLGQAQITLTTDGLQDRQTVVSGGGIGSGGTVFAESPAAGSRVKAGSKVTLTISEGSP
jgi:tRNA A-37 threonylcarbamoyl transferase component Bud32